MCNCKFQLRLKWIKDLVLSPGSELLLYLYFCLLIHKVLGTAALKYKDPLSVLSKVLRYMSACFLECDEVSDPK